MPSADKPQILDGDIVRAMTDLEFAQYEKDQIETAEQKQAEADRASLKQATINKLGLTAEEVAALLS